MTQSRNAFARPTTSRWVIAMLLLRRGPARGFAPKAAAQRLLVDTLTRVKAIAGNQQETARYPFTHSSTRQLTDASSMRVPLSTRPALVITSSAVVTVPTPGKTGRPLGTLASVLVR